MKKLTITTILQFDTDEEWETYKTINPLQIDLDQLEKQHEIIIMQTSAETDIISNITLTEEEKTHA